MQDPIPERDFDTLLLKIALHIPNEVEASANLGKSSYRVFDRINSNPANRDKTAGIASQSNGQRQLPSCNCGR